MLHIKSAQFNEQTYTCAANWWDETAPNNSRPCGKQISASEVKSLNGVDGPLCAECEAQIGETCSECNERWDNDLMENVTDMNVNLRLCPSCAEGYKQSIRQDRESSSPGMGQRKEDLGFNYSPLSAS